MSDPAHLLSLSDNAVKRVSFLMTQEENPDVMLRVVVDGGGCAGFQYGFSFDNKKTDDDIIVEQDGVKLVTDNMSLMYLAGSQIDFVEDMIGAFSQDAVKSHQSDELRNFVGVNQFGVAEDFGFDAEMFLDGFLVFGDLFGEFFFGVISGQGVVVCLGENFDLPGFYEIFE